MLERAKEKHSVDIYNYLQTIRKDRIHLVQTEARPYNICYINSFHTIKPGLFFEHSQTDPLPLPHRVFRYQSENDPKIENINIYQRNWRLSFLASLALSTVN